MIRRIADRRRVAHEAHLRRLVAWSSPEVVAEARGTRGGEHAVLPAREATRERPAEERFRLGLGERLTSRYLETLLEPRRGRNDGLVVREGVKTASEGTKLASEGSKGVGTRRFRRCLFPPSSKISPA